MDFEWWAEWKTE